MARTADIRGLVGGKEQRIGVISGTLSICTVDHATGICRRSYQTGVTLSIYISCPTDSLHRAYAPERNSENRIGRSCKISNSAHFLPVPWYVQSWVMFCRVTLLDWGFRPGLLVLTTATEYGRPKQELSRTRRP